MKSKIALLSLGLLSSSVFANDFNAQVEVDYFSADDVDSYTLSGSYYLDDVSLDGTAWSEAAFMGRNSNVTLQYTDFDNSVDATGLIAEFYGDENNNLYGAIGVINTDTPFGSDTSYYGEIGYFLASNWLVSLATTSSDADDEPIILKTKYVAELGGGKFFNFDASIDDESKDLNAAGDYFWNPQSSIGLELSEAEGFDYGVRFQHFFSEQVGLKLSYTALDDENVAGIGITARF